MPIFKQNFIRSATALLILLSAGCRAAPTIQPIAPEVNGVASTQAPTATSTAAAATFTAAPTATRAATRAAVRAPTVTATSTKQAAGRLSGTGICGPSPITQKIIDAAGPETWIKWVKQLSGAEPVTVDGKQVTITSRFSPSMFSGRSNARAFDFVLEQVRGWYPEEQIQVMPFTVINRDGQSQGTWKNLILTLPGKSKPGEVIILSAHLDSAARGAPEQSAPGAEDNASGSATLLEAARIFRDFQFERTIQIIWFTGEEQGLLGSKAFVEHVKAPKSIVGVLNLDMFGYDSDGDRCFEMHVGTLPQSDAVGRCFVQSIDAFHLGLPRYDYVTENAVHGSDHSSFWNQGIGAVEILENMFGNSQAGVDQPNACANADPDPNYHTSNDTYEKINVDTAARIARAALATAAGLAWPVDPSQ